MQKKYRGGQAAAILYNIKGAITVFLAISAASGLMFKKTAFRRFRSAFEFCLRRDRPSAPEQLCLH